MINKTVSAVMVVGFVALSASAPAVRAESTMQPWCSTFRGYSSGGLCGKSGNQPAATGPT